MKKRCFVAFGSNQSAYSESNDNPYALVHPFSPESKCHKATVQKASLRWENFDARDGICCLGAYFFIWVCKIILSSTGIQSSYVLIIRSRSRLRN